MVALRAHAFLEVRTMIAFTPVNGHADQILDSLLALQLVDAHEPQSCRGSPLETADNGKAQIDANERRLDLRSPIETGDNGNAQIDANERRLDLRSPIETADNGKAQIDANERRLDLRSPLETGDNGEPTVAATKDQRKDRDHKGRFTKGNPGGPGNPFARRLAALRTALCKAVTETDIEALAKKLLIQAHHGDVAAVKLLFAYAIGRPGPAVDPDTLDFHEWQVFQKVPVNTTTARQVLDSMPASLFCLLLRVLLPYKEDQMQDAVLEILQRADAEKPEPAPAARCA
jgi:hypothetical protein